MNIFIAGGTGAIGRFLVPLLVTAGHKVVASNAKAKREFNWQPAFPSWRPGFEALYSNRSRESSDAV
jgi:nucleoside-diphosphate-sugar epimerase